jgi:protein-tyrosine phosphatase
MRKSILAGALSALAFLTTGATVHAQTPAIQVQDIQARAHHRLLPLEGGKNFRDLGGYRTRDGHAVRWGLLYRSGAMDRLTDADFRYLSKLGVRTICDFRSTEERQAAPVRWPAGETPRIFADDYRLDTLGGMDFRAAGGWTGDQARDAMAAQYPLMLERFNGQYRRMFDQLLAGGAPLAFNCSAGKDRTGVAAALLLTALDVPRETVIEDYLLSNRDFDPKTSLAQDDASQAWKRLPPDVLQAFMGVDRSYIEAVFKRIDAHPGGAEGYLRDELGLSQAKLLTLRRLYTMK